MLNNGYFVDLLESGLALAAISLSCAALLSLFQRSAQRRRSRVHKGWRYLSPGVGSWFGLLGGLSATALFTYVYFFVGSARPDEASQMMALTLLCAGFNLMTVLVAYAIAVEQVRWTDTRIERRTFSFGTRQMSWSELARFGREPSGYLWVASYDGPKLRFSPFDNGVGELIAKVIRHLPRDLPPADFAVADAVVRQFATKALRA